MTAGLTPTELREAVSLLGDQVCRRAGRTLADQTIDVTATVATAAGGLVAMAVSVKVMRPASVGPVLAPANDGVAP